MAGLSLGVVRAHPSGAQCAVGVPAFAGYWAVEDPVTGSLHGGLVIVRA